jgi:hypothetical protein
LNQVGEGRLTGFHASHEHPNELINYEVWLGRKIFAAYQN